MNPSEGGNPALTIHQYHFLTIFHHSTYNYNCNVCFALLLQLLKTSLCTPFQDRRKYVNSTLVFISNEDKEYVKEQMDMRRNLFIIMNMGEISQKEFLAASSAVGQHTDQVAW